MDQFATDFALNSAPALKSHRPGEAPEKYTQRLARARLKRSELAEIEALYIRLNIEREAFGLAAADRTPFTPADILEWQDLKPLEKFLSLQSYAAACDRSTRTGPTPRLIIPPVLRQPRVLNKRDMKGAIPHTAKYCGRPSALGNPFSIGIHGNRAEVIAKHKAWLPTRPDLMKMMPGLKGLDLVCHCAPEPCHCDIYLELANPELRKTLGHRLLVCGGRDFNNMGFLEHCLDRTHVKTGIACIFGGGASGIDSQGREWAKTRGCQFETCPADWDTHAKPDGVIAFPGGKATADMIERTRKAGIKLWMPMPPA